MADGKAIAVLGVGAILALIFGVLSVINIGLYAGAGDLDADFSDAPDNCKLPCRERTSVLGIVAGSLGLVAAGATVALLALGLLESSTRAVNLLAKGVLLATLFIVSVFQITAWALMARDIDKFLDTYGSAACDVSPHLWNAALAFGLFAFIAVSLLFLVVAGGLVLDFMSSDGGSSGGGGGGGGRGGSYYGDHVNQSRAEQQEAQQGQQQEQQQEHYQ
ncbi:uncharacterized protein ACA1_060700 [Acanthamoeba castellanii str. Neff]|uniref:Transmembrane protein n=1 Tax=Acanthamoeba castellanii (strain ATCC 30010 / Neff) TaxID=1257118 RepID=L8GXQ2_ACACF|nr:uncharacterized protein ACA1_060700 [Acanthamoeba castellanii str. Neff]ELR17343.1 hypothetical protein ACA1_060700 [Acanthamoeba castellanii str. Neff]